MFYRIKKTKPFRLKENISYYKQFLTIYVSISKKIKSGCLTLNSHRFGRLWSIKYVTETQIRKILWATSTIKNSVKIKGDLQIDIIHCSFYEWINFPSSYLHSSWWHSLLLAESHLKFKPPNFSPMPSTPFSWLVTQVFKKVHLFSLLKY